MSRVAITGGTGFVGRHLAERLAAHGHDVVLVARGVDSRVAVRQDPHVRFARVSVTDSAGLTEALADCDSVVHCAGINREIGRQTYRAVHVDGTRAVVHAAREVGVRSIVMLSFLRARPDGPSAYHRSKWAAEEIVRGSGLSYTILKAGVIYGRGDHMLDHLSRAFHTVPVFALVGLREQLVRPVAVDDVSRILAAAALGDGRLIDLTLAVLGPEELTLGDAVRRVAAATGRRPLFIRLPVAAHRLLAIALEAAMTVPLIARAQVEILAEGVVEPLPFADDPPADLAPTTTFSDEAIRAGLPPAKGFGLADLRCSFGARSPTG